MDRKAAGFGSNLKALSSTGIRSKKCRVIAESAIVHKDPNTPAAPRTGNLVSFLNENLVFSSPGTDHGKNELVFLKSAGLFFSLSEELWSYDGVGPPLTAKEGFPI